MHTGSVWSKVNTLGRSLLASKVLSYSKATMPVPATRVDMGHAVCPSRVCRRSERPGGSRQSTCTTRHCFTGNGWTLKFGDDPGESDSTVQRESELGLRT